MFRRSLAMLALVVSTALPAAAGQILYATAAIGNRVEGFCVRDNGGLAPSPLREMDTIENPRRVIVSGDALYVAGTTRVEAFKIDASGRLTSLGRTPFVDGANPRDIAVDPARTLSTPREASPRRTSRAAHAAPFSRTGRI
jgi:hypothetical protein